MSGRLEGKVALVTGAAGGIGQATVAAFLTQGARVAACDVAEMNGGDSATLELTLDVRAQDQWEAAVASTEERFGCLDVVVNNAGISGPPAGVRPTREQWDEVIAIKPDRRVAGHAGGDSRAAPGRRRLDRQLDGGYTAL